MAAQLRRRRSLLLPIVGPESSSLHDASWKGDLKAVKTHLLFSGSVVNSLNPRGQTPLYCAAHEGNADVVEFLLAHGAEVNQSVHMGGSTALHAAAYGAVDTEGERCCLSNRTCA